MTDIYRRHELKYVLSSGQRRELEAQLEEHMRPDAYPESLVRSIYYDTPDYRLIRRSLEGPCYKEKLRFRCYGDLQPDENLFAELKKKYNGIVYKRRTVLPALQAENCMEKTEPLPGDSQILREIEAFRGFYGELIPAVYIAYHRTAWTSGADLRVTFDDEIVWSQSVSSLLQNGGNMKLHTGLLGLKESLLEVKAENALPLWLAQALDSVGAVRTAFSKYGSAFTSGCFDGCGAGRYAGRSAAAGQNMKNNDGGMRYVPFYSRRCG